MFFFFFSSRRRHTRCSRDWSSDVCSSDLDVPRRVHDGARDRRGATARSRGGCPRLPGEADQPARGPREDQALGREGTSRQFLLIVAIAQGALLVGLVILIVLNRWVRVRRG